MAPLRNTRHGRFAQELATGKSGSLAASAAIAQHEKIKNPERSMRSEAPESA